MGYETDIKDTGGNRLLRMLGLGAREEQGLQTRPRHSTEVDRTNLLGAIGDFLIRHDLAISAPNLVLAHAIISGTDMRLARKVRMLEEAGEQVTQQWLDEIYEETRGAEEPAKELESLARALDNSVAKFGESTRSAQQAASSYGDELQRQVELVDQVKSEEDVVSNLAHIAHVMLERTRDMEIEMRRGEEEARQLRLSLEKARRDATIDHLTSLPNRRAFEAVFERERLDAQRVMEPLCLAICDIDFFKKVNDTHGHDTGDRIIRATGQALNRISDNCHVARHGGEEFVLLFRGLNVEGSVTALNDARERFAARHFIDKVSGKPIGDVTFSGGVTDVFAHKDLSSALRAADEALYKAKESGRNRIEIA